MQKRFALKSTGLVGGLTTMAVGIAGAIWNATSSVDPAVVELLPKETIPKWVRLLAFIVLVAFGGGLSIVRWQRGKDPSSPDPELTFGRPNGVAKKTRKVSLPTGLLVLGLVLTAAFNAGCTRESLNKTLDIIHTVFARAVPLSCDVVRMWTTADPTPPAQVVYAQKVCDSGIPDRVVDMVFAPVPEDDNTIVVAPAWKPHYTSGEGSEIEAIFSPCDEAEMPPFCGKDGLPPNAETLCRILAETCPDLPR